MYRSRIPAIAKLFLPEIITRVNVPGKKIVYLTFDDGPIPETTPYILDTLKEYNVKATFFCVGENVKKYPDLYKRIIDEGHVTGNHTFNHLKGWKTSPETYLENANHCSEYVSSGLFRPPYGKMTISQYHALKKQFHLIFWDVLVPDFDAHTSVAYCLNVVSKKTRAGSIIIFHDNLKVKKKLRELLPSALNFFVREKFEIQPVTDNILKICP